MKHWSSPDLDSTPQQWHGERMQEEIAAGAGGQSQDGAARQRPCVPQNAAASRNCRALRSGKADPPQPLSEQRVSVGWPRRAGIERIH